MNFGDVLDEAYTPGGVSQEIIDNAEESLGIRFPDSFRRFLESYGAAMGDGWEVAGLGNAPDEEEPPMWVDVVVFTRQMRRAMGPQLPEQFIPISSTAGSVTYFLDVSEREYSPVLAFGPGIEEERVADSFNEFVINLWRDSN